LVLAHILFIIELATWYLPWKMKMNMHLLPVLSGPSKTCWDAGTPGWTPGQH